MILVRIIPVVLELNAKLKIRESAQNESFTNYLLISVALKGRYSGEVMLNIYPYIKRT